MEKKKTVWLAKCVKKWCPEKTLKENILKKQIEGINLLIQLVVKHLNCWKLLRIIEQNLIKKLLKIPDLG